jgi:hypothetical protein
VRLKGLGDRSTKFQWGRGTIVSVRRRCKQDVTRLWVHKSMMGAVSVTTAHARFLGIKIHGAYSMRIEGGAVIEF